MTPAPTTTPPPTITIMMIRHAPTVYPNGTVPPVDPDVVFNDESLVKRLARRIPDDAEWWVSPLSRCQKTAEKLIAFGAVGGGLITDNRLIEQDYGDWHGKDIAEIWEAVKDGALSNWHFLHHTVTPPNGESFENVFARMKPVMDSIMASPKENIVIIAHGMVIRALIGLALGRTAGASLGVDIAPLSSSVITYMPDDDAPDNSPDNSGGRWMVKHINHC